MQIITEARERAQQLLEENAATILTAAGVVGTVATAVLTGRASFKAAEIIRDEELKHVEVEPVADTLDDHTMGLSTREKVFLVGPLFLAPAITGSATVVSIIMGHRMNAQKAAALAVAYGLTQRQLEEYKAKVAEKLGPTKTQRLQDELAQERVTEAGTSQIVIIDGEVLVFDQPTGRYFTSSMEAIKQAENAINAEIIHHDHASASYFYEELGLPPTTWSDEVGWNTDNLVEIDISTVMSPDNKPCIAIDFKTLPKVNYVQRHYT